MFNIPFLIYHNISKDIDLNNKYTLSEDDLERHFFYLSSNSFRSILIDEFFNGISVKRNIFYHRIVGITFDDGYESSFTIVLPLLKKYNLKATFFITTDWIGQKGYMNLEQLRELKNAGMSIQSHCNNHRFLDELNHDDIIFELETSKRILENALNTKIDFFSCPGGRYSKQVIKIAEKLQYLALCSSHPFYFKQVKSKLGSKHYILGRENITQVLTFSKYKKLVASKLLYMITVKALYSLKKIIKKILGNNIYYFFWKKLMKSGE